MRLVTFQKAGGPQKAGAFLDNNSRAVDLAAAGAAAFGGDPSLASVFPANFSAPAPLAMAVGSNTCALSSRATSEVEGIGVLRNRVVAN
jgi:hypothetical protein